MPEEAFAYIAGGAGMGSTIRANREGFDRWRIVPRMLRDVSELRRRERELMTKDATIREIHHRVKNNLQTVAALLRLSCSVRWACRWEPVS